MNILNKPYNNYISLGYFCSIALDLEELGLRNGSYPFDWCITDFKGINSLIKNDFNNLFKEDNLYQSQNKPSHYQNVEYKFFFFHDFKDDVSLSNQIQNVKSKYNRRIKRFYNDIQEPTLFIRYISSEKVNENGKSIELEYIENNIDTIRQLYKSFNIDNEVIFIGDNSIQSDVIEIYHVPIDENDNVCRKPLFSNNDLVEYFTNVTFPKRLENLKRYQTKSKDRKNIFLKVKNKIFRIYHNRFVTKYKHYQTYIDD